MACQKIVEYLPTVAYIFLVPYGPPNVLFGPLPTAVWTTFRVNLDHLLFQVGPPGTPIWTIQRFQLDHRAFPIGPSVISNWTTWHFQLDHATLDEVQRVPDVLLAIKRSVDADPRPGRFLLTGSADVMTLPTVADSLAGRMQNIGLLPLSQAELHRSPSTFLDLIFKGRLPVPTTLHMGDALIARVVRGGYPGAVAKSSESRCEAWLAAYVENVLKRDMQDIGNIAQLEALPRLLQVASAYAGQLINSSQMGAAISLTNQTTQKYLTMLRQLYLVAVLPAWANNNLARAVKTPKLHFVDTGILAAQCDLDCQKLIYDRKAFRALLENFVYSEVAKMVNTATRKYRLYHYRDKAGRHEVDLIVVGPGGRMVGIEVKASSTVGPKDFNGLKQLAEAAGDAFIAGIVIHDNDVIVPYGEKMFAAPLSCLWH
jgi:predicted AAA+ superfamily ATPase